ncbi:hypothetical protein JMJ56_30420 [Belnapia sp. T18]|uniref:Protein NO VEIN C-terminal domain-containing protein n=1 Tax=Belnapia arida TaxID=2804533 RepID=A0ABS1UC80_9PROT|nr:hypothetical protein [Belnapia arida]MBL6082294.1 hypothetical protein [Belnapia arida]
MAALQDIIDEVNRRAVGRPIGALQDWRKENRGLGRKASHRVFGSIRTGDYAFHFGGREELQFNIGIETLIEEGDLRYGVAFSFEPSQSLPDIAPLVPKVALFNEYLRTNPAEFDGLGMWHHPLGTDRIMPGHPAPIKGALVRRGVFVFLGALGRSAEPDYNTMLDTLDRLLPLYRFVESGDGKRSSATEAWTEPLLQLRHHPPKRWTTANMVERTLDVDLRHNALQRRLCEELVRQYGEGRIGEEHPMPDGGRIDVVVDADEGRILFEIKTACTARGCIREAMGQVLDYACWPNGPRVSRVVVVGSPAPTPSETAYIGHLNQSFPLPLAYRRVVLEDE